MSNSSSSTLKWLKLDKDDHADTFYSCIGSIIASTALALHLHVSPAPPLSTSRSQLRRLWEADLLYQLRRQLCWAAMLVIAPELLLSLAFGDWRGASEGVAIFRALGGESIKDWGRTHANFANMGGIRFEMTRSDMPLPPTLSHLASHSMSSLEQCILKHQAPLNRKLSKWNLWRHIICQKISSAYWSIRRRAVREEPQIITPVAPDDAVELDDLSPGSDGDNPIVYVDEILDAIQELKSQLPQEDPQASPSAAPQTLIGPDVDDHRVGLNGILDATHERGGEPTQEHPQAGPSTAAQASIDVGELSLEDFPSTSFSYPGQDGENEVLHSGRRHYITRVAAQFVEDHVQEMQQLSSSLPPPGQRKTQFLYLNSRQIVTAQMFGLLGDIPDLNESAIQDKSKTNPLVKISAMVPLLWFVARLGVKKHVGKNISQLELASSTYILCCLVAYMFYWSKPQGVERPIEHRVELTDDIRPLTDQDLEFLALRGGSPFLSRNFVPPFGMDGQRVDPTQPIPTGTSLTEFAVFGGSSQVAFFDDDFAGTLAGMLFGGLYMLGWNSNHFPSMFERLAWRTALVAIIGSLIPYSIANGVCTTAYNDAPTPGGRKKTHVAHSLTLYALLGVYVLGRLYMLYGMIRDFFATAG